MNINIQRRGSYLTQSRLKVGSRPVLVGCTNLQVVSWVKFSILVRSKLMKRCSIKFCLKNYPGSIIFFTVQIFPNKLLKSER